MGVVYRYLDFLNQGVLPNNRLRPTSPVLRFIVDKSRKAISKTMVGDLVLWMLDHGIILKDKGSGNPDTSSISYNDLRCSNGPFQSELRVESSSSERTWFSSAGFFQSRQYDRLTIAAARDGYTQEVFQSSTQRMFNGDVFDVNATLTTTTSWTRLQSGLLVVSRKTTGTSAENSYIAPGYSGPSISGGSVIETPLSIPIVSVNDNTSFCTNRSVPLCGSSFYIPDVSGTIACGESYDFDPGDLPTEPPVLFGDLVYYELDGEYYFPAFSDSNISRDQSINFIRSLPLQKSSILVPRLQRDPVARELFGDIDPPLWYDIDNDFNPDLQGS